MLGESYIALCNVLDLLENSYRRRQVSGGDPDNRTGGMASDETLRPHT